MTNMKSSEIKDVADGWLSVPVSLRNSFIKQMKKDRFERILVFLPFHYDLTEMRKGKTATLLELSILCSQAVVKASFRKGSKFNDFVS